MRYLASKVGLFTLAVLLVGLTIGTIAMMGV